jgi:Uma2 family endonuclease
MLDDATMGRMTGHQHTDDASGSTRKLTYADFLKFPDDGRRHELIDGVHYVSPSPEFRHQQLSLRMAVALANYLEAMPIGVVLYAPMDCVLTMFDIVEPDLLVVLNDQKSIITKKNIRGMPAIAVEILSESTRAIDEERKFALYERAGAREYWIVDGDLNRLTVYRRGAKQFERPSTHSAAEGNVLTTPLLPGFSLALDRYFR